MARKHEEDDHQAALFNWLLKQYPEEYNIIFAIPNGGKRDIREAARLKRQGVKAGVPDICVPIPKIYFERVSEDSQLAEQKIIPALFIELKVRGRKETKLQVQMRERLVARGYAVAVCNGWEEAAHYLKSYLDKSQYWKLPD